MTSWGLVVKNLFRKKLRTFLTVFAILVAFAIYGVLASFQNSLSAPPSGASANRLITTNKVNFTLPLPINYLQKVRNMDEVRLVSHASWFGGYVQDSRVFFAAFAVDPESYLDIYTEFTLSPGARETFLKDRTAILVGKSIADGFGWKTGDRIPIKSNIFRQADGSDTWEFTVAGTFTNAEVEGQDQQVIFNYDYYNESISFGKDAIGQLIIETKDPKQNDATAQKIDAMFANSSAETETRTESAFAASFAAQFGDIGFIITAVSGAAFITILLIAGNTMMLTVRERTGEIAVLKTIGFTARRIFAMILSESMLLAVIGGLLGLGLAWLGVGALKSAGGFMAGIAMTPPIIITALVLMTGLGLLTGLLPAWRAMRTDIITAFSRK